MVFPALASPVLARRVSQVLVLSFSQLSRTQYRSNDPTETVSEESGTSTGCSRYRCPPLIWPLALRSRSSLSACGSEPLADVLAARSRSGTRVEACQHLQLSPKECSPSFPRLLWPDRLWTPFQHGKDGCHHLARQGLSESSWIFNWLSERQHRSEATFLDFVVVSRRRCSLSPAGFLVPFIASDIIGRERVRMRSKGPMLSALDL